MGFSLKATALRIMPFPGFFDVTLWVLPVVLLHLENTLITMSDKFNACEDRGKPCISLDILDLITSLTHSNSATCCGSYCTVMHLILHAFFTILNLKEKHNISDSVIGQAAHLNSVQYEKTKN
jgi:hypothetical protein